MFSLNIWCVSLFEGNKLPYEVICNLGVSHNCHKRSTSFYFPLNVNKPYQINCHVYVQGFHTSIFDSIGTSIQALSIRGLDIYGIMYILYIYLHVIFCDIWCLSFYFLFFWLTIFLEIFSKPFTCILSTICSLRTILKITHTGQMRNWNILYISGTAISLLVISVSHSPSMNRVIIPQVVSVFLALGFFPFGTTSRTHAVLHNIPTNSNRWYVTLCIPSWGEIIYSLFVQ